MKYINPLLLTALILTACKSDSGQPEIENYQIEKTSSFFDTNWILTELNGESVSENESNQSIPTILFIESEKRFNGRGGCNQYNGGFEYDRESGEVGLSQIAATKMACPDMVLEDRYFSMLDEVEQLEQSSQRLQFFNSSGEIIAQFEVIEN